MRTLKVQHQCLDLVVVEATLSSFRISHHLQMMLLDSPQSTMRRDQYPPRLGFLNQGIVQLLVMPQWKVALNKYQTIQPFYLQIVSLLDVCMLKDILVVFPHRSTTSLTQDSNCKLLQFRALATKLLAPIRF